MNDYRDALDESEDGVDLGSDPLDTERRRLVVEACDHGTRLDRWLADQIPAFSRSYLQGLIDAGAVAFAGAGQGGISPSRKVKLGESYDIELRPTPQSQAFRPEPMVLDVVAEDDALLVVNKPAGLVVHPAAGHWSGTLLNGLLAHHEGARHLPRAGIVHRLDKDTSGLMVVGKTLEAVTSLSRAIAAREVRREYVAVVHGRPQRDAFTIEGAIGRDPQSRVRMAMLASGKPARTDVRVLARGEAHAVVACRLHTGRTHQIRVHLSHLGHPLVGDAVYGGRAELGMQRQALHACRLALLHPVSQAPCLWTSALPPDLAGACAQLGWEGVPPAAP